MVAIASSQVSTLPSGSRRRSSRTRFVSKENVSASAIAASSRQDRSLDLVDRDAQPTDEVLRSARTSGPTGRGGRRRRARSRRRAAACTPMSRPRLRNPSNEPVEVEGRRSMCRRASAVNPMATAAATTMTKIGIARWASQRNRDGPSDQASRAVPSTRARGLRSGRPPGGQRRSGRPARSRHRETCDSAEPREEPGLAEGRLVQVAVGQARRRSACSRAESRARRLQHRHRRRRPRRSSSRSVDLNDSRDPRTVMPRLPGPALRPSPPGAAWQPGGR